jgi:hypothetical protein
LGNYSFGVLAGPWRTAVLMCMLAGRKTVFLHVTVNTLDKNLQENSFFAVSFLQILGKKLLIFLRVLGEQLF